MPRHSSWFSSGPPSNFCKRFEYHLPLLRETNALICQFCDKKLLYRKDSAHDSLDIRVELAGYAKTDYIIKWNPRKENAHYWWQKGLETGAKRTVTFRRVMRVTDHSTKDMACVSSTTPRSRLTWTLNGYRRES